MMKEWEVVGSKYLLKEKYLTVRSDHVRMPSSHEISDFYVIEYPNWINVIAITAEGLFIIEKQYRNGIRAINYEICAGMIDEGETPIEAARRELLEETGYGGGKWVEFCITTPNPSSMNNYNYTFLAVGVTKVAKVRAEESEEIEVELLTLEQVKQLLLDGKITEGIMQAPLWRYIYENKERPVEWKSTET